MSRNEASETPAAAPLPTTWLCDAISSGIVLHDAAGAILYTNQAACELFDLPAEELLGAGLDAPCWKAIREDGTPLQGAQHPVQGVLQGGQPMQELIVGLHPDRPSPRWLLLQARPLLDAAGLAAAISTLVDISAQKRAERARARLEEIVATVPGVLWEVWGRPGGSSQQSSFVSRYVERLLGYTIEESLPTFPLQIVHPADRERVLQEMTAIFERGGHGNSQFRWVARDGRPLWVMASCLVVQDEQGTPIGMRGVTTDISERREAEQALLAHAEQLAHTMQALERSNQELDQFAYVASHDLKAPLRGISNLVQWLEEELADSLSDEGRQLMALLRNRTSRMEKLIEGILQYSRVGRQQEPPERIDVGDLLHEIIDLLDPPDHFTIHVAADMPCLLTERLLLQQVFMNLISNGIKHHDRSEGQIWISCQESERQVEFLVADDGPGIDPRYHDKIFVIFQTLQPRDKVEGAGVGLSIVKKIVEYQGGSVHVDSDPGRGTTFRFTWPKQGGRA